MDNVVEAPFTPRVRHDFHACAVDRGVDNLQVGLTFDYFRVKAEGVDCVEELAVHFLSDNLYVGGIALELDVGHVGDAVHMVDYVHVVRCDNLGAVAPISLISVVFLGVVRCCDVHAALAAELAYCER